MPTLARAAAVVEEYLLAWVLASVALSLFFPGIAALTPFSTAILVVMIGSISLTLSPGAFRQVRPRALATILAVQTGMPVAAYLIARALALSPVLTVGFVVLGAVTPGLATPVMTELGGGDTALATTALVLVGLGTLVLVPTAVTLLAGGDALAFETARIVERLLLAVVIPMTAAVAVRARYPERVGQYEEVYPAVSALMVVLVIGSVTAANAALVRSSGAVVLVVGVGAVTLNATG